MIHQEIIEKQGRFKAASLFSCLNQEEQDAYTAV